ARERESRTLRFASGDLALHAFRRAELFQLQRVLHALVQRADRKRHRASTISRMCASVCCTARSHENVSANARAVTPTHSTNGTDAGSCDNRFANAATSPSGTR